MLRIVDSPWLVSPPEGDPVLQRILLIPLVGTVVLVAALTVVGWARERRRERTAFYRHEVLRVLAEQGKADVESLRQLDQEALYQGWRRRREALKLAGFVLAGLGVGLLLALRGMEKTEELGAGYVPLVTGVAVLLYAFVLAPGARKEER